MNKRIFTFLMVSILAGLLCTSCKDDEEALASKIGVLSGDDAKANVRVKDVRLISVGNYWYGFNPFWKYSYTNFGKLNSFSSTDYMTADVDGSKIIMNAYSNGEVRTNYHYTMDIKDNHIVALSLEGSYSERFKDFEVKYVKDASFSYNSKGQLVSVIASGSKVGTKNGEPYCFLEDGTVTFTYSSDYRLLSIEKVYNYEENGVKGMNKNDITCEYTTESPRNLFYQYCPFMLFNNEIIEDLNGLFYVGLFGKASSFFPSNYIIVGEVLKEGKEAESGSFPLPSSQWFNDNGTLHYSDFMYYVYSNEDDPN